MGPVARRELSAGFSAFRAPIVNSPAKIRRIVPRKRVVVKDACSGLETHRIHAAVANPPRQVSNELVVVHLPLKDVQIILPNPMVVKESPRKGVVSKYDSRTAGRGIEEGV